MYGLSEEERRQKAVMREVLPNAAMWRKWEKTEAPLRQGRGWYPTLDRHFLELLVISEIACLSHPLAGGEDSPGGGGAGGESPDKIHRHAYKVRRVACERIGQERLGAYCERVKEAFEAYVSSGGWWVEDEEEEEEDEEEVEVEGSQSQSGSEPSVGNGSTLEANALEGLDAEEEVEALMKGKVGVERMDVELKCDGLNEGKDDTGEGDDDGEARGVIITVHPPPGIELRPTPPAVAPQTQLLAPDQSSTNVGTDTTTLASTSPVATVTIETSESPDRDRDQETTGSVRGRGLLRTGNEREISEIAAEDDGSRARRSRSPSTTRSNLSSTSSVGCSATARAKVARLAESKANAAPAAAVNMDTTMNDNDLSPSLSELAVSPPYDRAKVRVAEVASGSGLEVDAKLEDEMGGNEIADHGHMEVEHDENQNVQSPEADVAKAGVSGEMQVDDQMEYEEKPTSSPHLGAAPTSTPTTGLPSASDKVEEAGTRHAVWAFKPGVSPPRSVGDPGKEGNIAGDEDSGRDPGPNDTPRTRPTAPSTASKSTTSSTTSSKSGRGGLRGELDDVLEGDEDVVMSGDGDNFP